MTSDIVSFCIDCTGISFHNSKLPLLFIGVFHATTEERITKKNIMTQKVCGKDVVSGMTSNSSQI